MSHKQAKIYIRKVFYDKLNKKNGVHLKINQ